MVLCAILLIVVAGISYAFSTLYLEGTKKQVVNAGTLSLELDEDENNLTIENAMPMYDEVGLLQESFTFRVINNTDVTTKYILRLVDITAKEKLDTSIVKYAFTKNGVTSIDYLSNLTDGILDKETIKTEPFEYELRLWIDWNVEDETLISGESLSYKLEIEYEKAYSYLVNFDLNGGEGEIASQIKNEEEALTLTSEIPTKEGYMFAGWSTTPDGDVEYVSNDTFEINSDTTLYAIWTTEITTYSYTGTVEIFTVPITGTYQIQLWGAQGGSSYGIGGKGGYTKGTINLNKNVKLFVTVGGAGGDITAGYNGGGIGVSDSVARFYLSSGGGATDIRIAENNITERIMVAAGGSGSAKYSTSWSGSYGGGLTGGNGYQNTFGSTSVVEYKSAGTQTEGTFGTGNTSAGGGWRAGYLKATDNVVASSGGGSSYISGHPGCIAIVSKDDTSPKVSTYSNIEDSYHHSGKIFTNTQTIAGNASMPNHAGTANMTGNSGNGYAKITFIEATVN